MNKRDLKGLLPESWACIDCGVNTAPGCMNRQQAEEALARDWNNKGFEMTFGERSEVYTVKERVWEAAGMAATRSGCLCIGCLERRIGRTLVPKDFVRRHPFHKLPGTERLLARRDGRKDL